MLRKSLRGDEMPMQTRIVPDATVVYAMWQWLNEWPDKPPGIAEISLDAMDKYPPAMLLQPLSGTVVERGYVNGSFIGSWPFSVVIKQNIGDDADRVDSFAALMGIYEWMLGQQLPVLQNNNTAHKVEMTALPMKSAVDDSGTEYYEATFALTYHHKEDN